MGVETETEQQDEAEAVYAWRLRQLRRAGFDELDAELLAADPDVDLHQALGLLDAGCPARLATRILG